MINIMYKNNDNHLVGNYILFLSLPLYISLYIHKQTKAVVSNNNTKNSDKERKSPNLIQSYVHLI